LGHVGEGTGTITLRASTLHAIVYDMVRSLLHSGFKRFVIVNNQGSNIKVMDPILRKLRYDTGAFICMTKLYGERYMGIIKEIMENPPEETPGWHSSELETSQVLAYNEKLVRMDRAVKELTHGPKWLPKEFHKNDGMPEVSFKGFEYFTFPMEHRDFSDTGTIGNPLRGSKEKGEKCLDLYSTHLAEAIAHFEKVPVELRPGVQTNSPTHRTISGLVRCGWTATRSPVDLTSFAQRSRLKRSVGCCVSPHGFVCPSFPMVEGVVRRAA
jgi:creatinine amidohydrolase